MKSRNRIVALLFAVLLSLGVALISAPSAAAATTRNSVENSSLSGANILVCGGGSAGNGCVTLTPGQSVFQTPGWNPTQVAVGSGQSILYRAMKDDVIGPWSGMSGPNWLAIEGMQNYLGGGVRAQIIMKDPIVKPDF